MLNLLRKITPKSAKLIYHRLLANFAKSYYRSPSERLIVIGVTGTSGKSSVVYLITRMLEQAGFRVGAASTIFFKVDKKEWLNDQKMTMVGRMKLQQLIAQMAKANCQYAIVETTSEGIVQHRHAGINYDVVVMTNLYPEHIESHGSFENYKNAKLKLFEKLSTEQHKKINEQVIKKVIIANLDDEHAHDFLKPEADEKYGYTFTNVSSDAAKVVRAEQLKVAPIGSSFQVDKHQFNLKLPGEHNARNALAAICVGRSQGLNLSTMAKGLEKISGIPGRIEFIDEGQKFKVIVDYSFEPHAMTKLYEVISSVPHKKIIHVLGGTGGGRDISRRPKIGALAGERADIVIVTNEDPYDEDPQQIIKQVAAGAQSAGKLMDKDLFTILDRRQAIAKACQLAQAQDMVLITGKGSEQAIVVKGNKKIPWDDRKVVREELKK